MALSAFAFSQATSSLRLLAGVVRARVDEERLRGDERDRLEIVQQIEAEIVNGAVRHVGAPHAPQERVAVGL